jgi:translation initiation factor 5
MVTSEKHQKSLLGGIEHLTGLEYPELITVVPKILMAFYQADVLEEDVVMFWGTHVSKKYVDKETSKKVRKASEPFLKVNTPCFGGVTTFLTTDNNIQWLAEADDDDDD